MRRALTILGMCVAGTCLSLASLAADEEIIQAHGLMRRTDSSDEPQRIVIKLPPPRVEYEDKCTESKRRFNLLTCRHKKDEGRSAAAASTVMYAPVNLPAMVVQPAAATSSFTQQITHDFSALQNAHELEMRAAALAAHSAARRAMADAENELLQNSLNRVHQKMSAMASAAGPSAAAAKGDGGVSLETALRNMDARLTKLEELVLQHQELLQRKAPKKTEKE